MHRRVLEGMSHLALAAAALSGPLMVPANAHDVVKPSGSAATRANPLPHSDAVVAAGQGIYETVCQSCHAPSGNGDTPAASALSHRPPDFTKGFKGQSDGVLFWKITKGGGPMPGYERTLTEQQRWQVIHYLRTLEKPTMGPRP